MSFMTIDVVDEQTGETHELLVARNEAPEFGQSFEVELAAPDGQMAKAVVRRVPSVLQRPLIARYESVNLQQRRYHPAFKHHDRRGFGVCTSKAEVQAALDWSKQNATSEDDVWTFNDKDKL